MDIFLPTISTFISQMVKLISTTMLHYLLKGERNLGIERAKMVGKLTGTDPIVWIDPARVLERRAAWGKTFPKKRRAK